ncbi:type I-E CRISPR-associated protein Cas6/Cse3/CasE [Streptomyces polyrhachis]|uniref:Type I-E CRISPR-associated protein Cas6/Cse3/CasE n=1 Tax=Streptomyces polyrhachis TaxID=1282885 RepID=A0ABW2GD46_9ACTN
MYLTRFRFNTARSGARRLLGSPHLLHGAVNMSFPQLPARDAQGPRVLWRVDRDNQTQTQLYIVSPSRPDLTHLVEQAGWPTLDEPGWATFTYGEFLEALGTGDTWAFRLTANPVHNIRLPQDAPGDRTRRTAHVTPHYQMRWLLEREGKSGFEVLRKPADKQLTQSGDEHELIVRDQRPLQFGGSIKNQRRNDVRLIRVTYDGRLRITDADVFRRTLTQGLGKAKAYGCGLMTLTPVSTR